MKYKSHSLSLSLTSSIIVANIILMASIPKSIFCVFTFLILWLCEMKYTIFLYSFHFISFLFIFFSQIPVNFIR